MTLNQGKKTKHIAKGSKDGENMTMQGEKNSMKHKVPLCLIIIVVQTLTEINLEKESFRLRSFPFLCISHF